MTGRRFGDREISITYNQMRILIITMNYKPELIGIGKYSAEMAEWLSVKGLQVKVITAPPYYPAWKISEPYSSTRYVRETLAGVSLVRCPLWVPKKPTGLKRVLHLLTFALTSLPVVVWSSLSWKPNLVFVVEPPLLCGFSALVAGKFVKAKTWLHVQDFEVDAAFNMGILKSKRIRRIAQSIEHRLMSRFECVSTISERMIIRLSEKKVPVERQVLFENWVDTRVIYPMDRNVGFRKELGIGEDKIILLYAGNLGKKQGLEIIAQAAKDLEHRNDIRFVLCGDGSALDDLRKTSQYQNNMVFIPLQPVEKLNHLLSMADIHLLPQRSDIADLVMPSKLSNMMASGRPVITTAMPGTQVSSVVRECGYVVTPGDLKAFVEAIKRLVDDRDQRISFGKRAREIALQRWEKDTVLSIVFRTYLKIATAE